MTRREFIAGAPRVLGSVAASGSLLALLAVSQQRRIRWPSNPDDPGVLRPPGALAESEFLGRCIRCQRCCDACPVGAIQLAGPGDPWSPGTPFLAAADRACNLCLECTQSCPTGALQPLTDNARVRMGMAVVNEDTCVSFNRTGVCGACHTACPFRNQAITLGLHNAPTVHADHCVGCGLCEEACILKGTKAIRIFSGRRAA